MIITKEHFKSIAHLMNTIEGRENNPAMEGEHSSRNGTREFTGSDSYSEAKELLRYGYKDILDEIKREVRKYSKIQQTRPQRQIMNDIIGYAPNVPNAIQNLPNSMVNTITQPTKVKAVSIVYSIVENCGTDAEEFIKSGVALLNVINRLELSGIRVNLKIAFYVATVGSETDGNDYTFGTVDVKHYREHLDIQKLCFPLAHPSMFRRFGFKWIETVPGLDNRRWSFGYGRSISDYNDKAVLENIAPNKDDKFINLSYMRDANYNVDNIIKEISKSS